MSSQEISFHNPDGSSNAFELFEPRAAQKAVVMVFPAMGVKASYYAELGRQLAKAGYIAALCELRGHGRSSLRPSRKVNFGYSEMLHYDYKSAFDKMKEMFPDQPIYFLGHSLGGQLGSLFAAEHPDALAGLILVASCSVYYKGWQGMGRFRVWIGTQFAAVVAQLLGYFPGKRIGFGGLEAAGVMADWSRQARTGKYLIGKERLSYEAKLGKVALPVLAITFEADKLCPEIPARNLYQKFNAQADITHFHLLPDDPRNDGFHHFNWAKKPANIIGMLEEWRKNLIN